MKLCLVRHAEAVERGGNLAEAWRYLTPEGRTSFRKASRRARKEGLDPDCILTSPLLRAVQTAEILAQTLKHTGPVVVTEELSPGFGMKEFRTMVDSLAECRELVLVGHEPDLGLLAGQLLGKGSAIPFKKGAVLSLELDLRRRPASATFRWLVTGKKVRTDLAELAV